MANIQLNVELENADSKERYELDCPYESDSAEVANAAAALLKANDNQSIIKAVQEALSPGSELYTHFLRIFAWQGHDKVGWHDVQVFIRSIIVDGTELPIDADEISENDLSDGLTLQLIRAEYCGNCHKSNELFMEFLG